MFALNTKIPAALTEFYFMQKKKNFFLMLANGLVCLHVDLEVGAKTQTADCKCFCFFSLSI